MHDEVGVRQPLVDLGDRLDRQDLAVRLARELVGAVARADRDGKSIDARLGDEVEGWSGSVSSSSRESLPSKPWPSSLSPALRITGESVASAARMTA